jgi:hypothetical protein
MNYKIYSDDQNMIEIISSNEDELNHEEFFMICNSTKLEIKNIYINKLTLSRDVRLYLVDLNETIILENCVIVDKVLNFIRHSEYFKLINCYNKNAGDI